METPSQQAVLKLLLLIVLCSVPDLRMNTVELETASMSICSTEPLQPPALARPLHHLPGLALRRLQAKPRLRLACPPDGNTMAATPREPTDVLSLTNKPEVPPTLSNLASTLALLQDTLLPVWNTRRSASATTICTMELLLQMLPNVTWLALVTLTRFAVLAIFCPSTTPEI